ncbi:MAG TPA: NAD(P) transhydrogenase subunit alpha [Solirubrobacteraceae bacterium]|nr:NAD(P) transhydrogenase subunit alpha [Solirubrobacteraceae bacterium]
MRIAVPKERAEGERRVALVPDSVEKLVSDGHEVVVEAGAGGDFYPDEGYAQAGAQVVEDDPTEGAAIVLKVAAPSESEAEALPEGSLLVCFLDPSQEGDVLDLLAQRRVTAFSLSSIPRTGAAQAMDAISSMSSVAGYQAVLMAAEAAGRYLPMMTTAAGTTKAAKVMVLGVGVAGLQAIATARRLGAEVEAFDIRPEVADQVRSLGARFIEAEEERSESEGGANGNEPAGPELPEPGPAEVFVKALLGLPEDFGRRRAARAAERARAAAREDAGADTAKEQGGYASEQDEEKQKRDQELMTERLGEMDIVLTTALVPGRRAPTLVTAEMVERMKPGAVLFDLAVEAGGNCELSEPGEVVVHDHVHIHGPRNLPSTMPIHASFLLSRNLISVLSHLIDDEGELELDFEDEITDAAVLAHGGERRNQ